MHEAVHPTEVDEGSEVDDRGDNALSDLAGLEVHEELAALFALGLLEPRSPRKHDVVAVLVELDDLGLEGLADVGLQVAHPTELDERGRQEAPETDVNDQPALYDLDHEALDDST